MQSPRLSRDEVARVALGILEEWGLQNLTMRRLAAELDVQPSALYWHFRDKQSLLAHLADLIVLRAPRTTEAGSWDDRLRREAHALRAALLAARDSAEIVASTLALELGDAPARARMRAALEASPFDAALRERAAATMLLLVLGRVSLEQQQLHYDSIGARTTDGSDIGPDVRDADFTFGVDTLILGLRARAREIEQASQ